MRCGRNGMTFSSKLAEMSCDVMSMMTELTLYIFSNVS